MFICLFCFADGPELQCPSSYTAVEHTPHSLRCNVSGFPQPQIIWSKEGVEVELPESLSRHDAGQYTVTASILNVTINTTVDITVTCKWHWWRFSYLQSHSSIWFDCTHWSCCHRCLQTHHRRSWSLKMLKLRLVLMCFWNAPRRETHGRSMSGATTRRPTW